jgi:ABC-2 type transport system permease protein
MGHPVRGGAATQLWAVCRLSFLQLLRSRRTLVFALLGVLPPLVAILFAVLRRLPALHINAAGFDFFSVLMATFYLHFLLVLVALFYATALIHSEVEDKTLTYLLLRPASRRTLVLGKYLTYVGAAAVLLLPSVAITFGILEASDGGAGALRHLRYLAWDGAVLMLGTLAYGSLFAFLGTALKRPVMVGLFIAVVWEWVVSHIPGILAKVTILHYLLSVFPHSTVQRGVQAVFGSPTSRPVAVLVLLGIGALFLGLSTELFRSREYVLEQ